MIVTLNLKQYDGKIKKQSANPELNQIYQLFFYVDSLTKYNLPFRKGSDRQRQMSQKEGFRIRYREYIFQLRDQRQLEQILNSENRQGQFEANRRIVYVK